VRAAAALMTTLLSKRFVIFGYLFFIVDSYLVFDPLHLPIKLSSLRLGFCLYIAACISSS
jgi:hypothetical protein